MSDNRYGCTTEKRALVCVWLLHRSVLASKADLKAGKRGEERENRRNRDTTRGRVYRDFILLKKTVHTGQFGSICKIT